MRTVFHRFAHGALVAVLFAACTGPTSTTTVAPASNVPTLTPVWSVQPGASTYYINSVAISADSNRVVAGTFYHDYGKSADQSRRPPEATSGTPAPDPQIGKFGTYCYDATGKQIWADVFTAWQGVYWVDISSDGAWAAGGGWMSQKPYNGFVRAYDASNGKIVLDYSTTARVNQVALSRDGTWLVSAANTLVLFQRVNGTYQKVDEYTTATKDTYETIGFSTDGRTLVTGAYSGKILLFGIDNGKFGTPVSWTLPGGGYSHSVRVTPDGAAFAAGGSKGNFYLFDTANFRASGQPSVTYQVPNAGSIYGVAIAENASAFVGIANVSGGTGMVYCVGKDGTLKWKFATQHNPNSACYNTAANLVAVADGHPDDTPGAFYLLDAANGTLKGQYDTTNMSWPIVIAANGVATAAGSDDSKVYYFNNTTAVGR